MLETWYQCGLNLLTRAGKYGPGSIGLPGLYRQHSLDQSPEFLLHLMALISVESAFDKQAHSDSAAFGLMQITQVAVTDAVRTCGLRPLRRLNELYDSATNIRYGSCYLSQLLEENQGDWDRTFIQYNGGYRQLFRYNTRQSMAAETANYLVSINRALKECQVLEEK